MNNPKDETLKDYVTELLEGLVDDTAELNVSPVSGEASVIMEVKVSKPDFGRVIGKGGRTIAAIRTVVEAAAGKLGRRAQITMLEND